MRPAKKLNSCAYIDQKIFLIIMELLEATRREAFQDIEKENHATGREINACS